MADLQSALAAAGIEPAEHRLARIAVDALAANPRNLDGAKDFVFSAVRNDAGLLWELTARYRQRAVYELLTGAAEGLRREAGGGQLMSAQTGHRSNAPTEPTPPASGKGPQREGSGAGARMGMPSGQLSIAPAPHNHRTPENRAFPAPPQTAAQPTRPTAARGIGGMDAVGAVAALSLLDTISINGQKIGDVKPREARAWANTHAVKSRFVLLLIANLPEDQPIRKYRTAEDAATIYKQAENEYVG